MTAGETTRSLGIPAGLLREVVVVVAVCLLLVAGVNALGLLARLSGLVLRRFWAWWPPESLEAVPLAVAGLVMLVTAYALATRGNRMRSPDLPKGRRFLPPLDLLLLQLGNVTFVAFALILAIVTLGLLSSALRALVTSPWLAKHGLSASLGVAALAALSARRSSAHDSWNAARRRWSRRALILGGAVGAFWLIGGGAERTLLKLRWEDLQIDPPTLAGLYGLLWVVLIGSMLIARLGQRPIDGSKPTAPRRRLAVTASLAWIAYLGFLTLYLNSVLLTLRGHLAEG